MNATYLVHHGVPGQKRGVRRAPWYPIADWLASKKNESKRAKFFAEKIETNHAATLARRNYSSTAGTYTSAKRLSRDKDVKELSKKFDEQNSKLTKAQIEAYRVYKEIVQNLAIGDPLSKNVMAEFDAIDSKAGQMKQELEMAIIKESDSILGRYAKLKLDYGGYSGSMDSVLGSAILEACYDRSGYSATCKAYSEMQKHRNSGDYEKYERAYEKAMDRWMGNALDKLQ